MFYTFLTPLVLNFLRIMHFLCKFLGPKKSACVNVLTYSTSATLITNTNYKMYQVEDKSNVMVKTHFELDMIQSLKIK